MKKFRLIALICTLALMVTGCSVFSAKTTKTANPPPLSEVEANTQSKMSFGIYPAGYDVENYKDGLDTVDLKFTVGSDLAYPSTASIFIKLPLQVQLNKNPGFEGWADTALYCQLLDTDLTVPANSEREFTLRIQVPEGVRSPLNWLFYVAYQLDGHKWGSYQVTSRGNFVFTPYCFECSISDSHQDMVWLTWGNSPQLMVRAAYGNPPETPEEGELVYQGRGEQVIRDWTDPNTGKVLDRQYTLYTISDNRLLPIGGGTTLFYRAWQEHLVNGVPDGTWDIIGQSMVIPEVNAKVTVSK